MGGSLMRETAAGTVLWPRRLDRHATLRMLGAGSAWGLVMATGFVGYAVWSCGGVCLEDAALVAITFIAAGILTIGPLAAFGRGSV
jgi:hypothetical protein